MLTLTSPRYLIPNKTKQQVNRRALSNLRNNPSGPGDTIVKRMTLSGQTLTRAAVQGAVLTRSCAEVQSVPAAEWASFAARYQQFRVRRLRISARACYPADADPTGVSGDSHSALYVSDHIGTSVPSTAAQVFSDEAGRTFPTYKDFMYEVTWSRNPNAKLWNPTSAALPAANDYGISLAVPAAPTLLSTTYHSYVLEWEVEFRGSQ